MISRIDFFAIYARVRRQHFFRELCSWKRLLAKNSSLQEIYQHWFWYHNCYRLWFSTLDRKKLECSQSCVSYLYCFQLISVIGCCCFVYVWCRYCHQVLFFVLSSVMWSIVILCRLFNLDEGSLHIPRCSSFCGDIGNIGQQLGEYEEDRTSGTHHASPIFFSSARVTRMWLDYSLSLDYYWCCFYLVSLSDLGYRSHSYDHVQFYSGYEIRTDEVEQRMPIFQQFFQYTALERKSYLLLIAWSEASLSWGNDILSV